jgi:hypothetical protein
MRYESNPKHSGPWQTGRKGSLCRKELKALAMGLLEKSELVGKKRFTFHEGRAYCAQEHGDDVWHGYPVGWQEVPAELRNKWKRAKLVSKRDLDRYWESDS